MANDIKIYVKGDATELVSAMRQGQQALNGLARDVSATSKASEALTLSIARMGHAAAAGLGVREVVQAADAWSNLSARLSLVAGSTSTAAAAYANVLRIAQETRQGLSEVGGVYEKFARQSVALGLSQERLVGLTRSVSQAMAVSGASAQSAQAALTQFGQALASGVLRGEELNSILEQSPRLAQALADGLDVPVGKLKELGEAGEITSQKIVRALESQAGRLNDEFSRMPVTIGGALTKIDNAWTDVLGKFQQSTGVFGGLAKALEMVAENMTTIATVGGVGVAVAFGRITSAVAGAVAAWYQEAQAARAAMVAELASLQAKREHVAMLVAQAQASVAAATGMQRLAIVQAELVPLQQRLTASTAAVVAAQRGLATGGAVLGALGGPIGAIATALTLGATAWLTWGRSAEESAKRAQASLRDTRTEAEKWADTQRKMEALARGEGVAKPAGASEKWASAWRTREEEKAADLAALAALRNEEVRSARLIQTRTQRNTRLLAIEQEYQVKRGQIEEKYASKSVKREQSETERMVDAIKSRIAVIEAAGATTGQLTQSEKDWAEIVATSSAAVQASVKPYYDRAIALEKNQKATEAASQTAAEWFKNYNDHIADQEKSIKGLEDEAARLVEQNENYGKLRSEIEATAIARLEERIALAKADSAHGAYLESLEAELAARRKIRDAAKGVEAQDVAKKAADESKKAWEDFSRDIERSLTDALMRSFENGENAGEAFVKSLKNTIKAAVLKMAVQVVMQPVMGSLQSMLGGGGGSGGQAGGAGVSISDMASLANMSSTPFTAGFNRLAGSSMFGSSLMETLPSGFVGPPALTATGSTMAGAASFLDSYGGYIGAALQLAQGNARGAAFTAAGSYIGSLTPVGPIIGSIIGSILGGLFGGSGERFATMTGQSSGTYDDGRFTSGTMNRDWGSYAGAASFGTDIEAALNRTVQAYTGRIGSLFDAFGLEDTISARADTRLRRTSGSVASNFHVDLDGVNGPLGEIRPISADYGEDGEVQQALADFINDIMTDGIKAAVAASTLPELVKDLFEPLTESKEIEEALATVINAQKYLIKEGTTLTAFLGANAQEFMVGEENLVGALNRVITSLSVINPILEDINQSAYAMTMAGGDAASQLAALSGGVEAFASKANAYYQEYFSDDERLAKLQAKVEETFADLDIEMPDTKAEFRAIVESLDLTTAAGRGTFAALMDLSPAFAEIANAASNATETVSEAVSQILKRLQQDRAALEADLLEAQGNPNAANAARRAIAIQGMNAAEIAAWDYNEALRAQIAGYQAATEAAAQAQAAQDELDRSRLDWTQKIAVLKGETTQQEIERINLINSTTDDYTQSLINAYYALLDVNAATEEAARLAEEAARLAEEEAQKTRQANDLRTDLTRQMNDLGRTGLGNALHDIALRAAAYRKELEELGRATDANLAVVANWQAAMQRNILANDSLQRMQAISGRMDAVAGVRGSLQDSIFSIQSQRAGFNAVDYWTEQAREAGQGLIGGPLEDRLAAAQSVRDALMNRYSARLEVINKSLAEGTAAIEANARAAEAAARKQFALEEDARRTAIAQANTLNAAYRSVGAYAKSLLQSELSPLSGKAQLTYNRREYNRLLTASRTGDLTALGGLSDAAGSYLESARAQSITAVDYARTFARTRNELTRLGNKAGTDIEFVAREFYFNSQDYDRQKLELQRSTDASIALLQTITADRLTHLVERTDTWTANLEEQLRDEAVVYATLTQGVIDSRDALKNVDSNVREAVIDARAARATWNAMWARIQDDNGTLVQEVRALRADLAAQNSTIARNTATTARLLDSVTDGGNNMLTVAA